MALTIVCLVLEGTVAVVALLDETAASALQSGGALAHVTRRRVMSLLVEHDVLRREQVARELADDDAVPEAETERIDVELHHHHLPKLDDEQFIDYDHRSGDVVLWEDADTVTELIGTK
ncbi:DUF7344 domain-containing protein [Natronorubrum thiooxidans]|uniref:DUF7344 domain-containing protein n=1 Tax=Natronorubrum thiooxidans TaxID=308853 RepID=A0A1N7DN04_9EURY|nr:hypothetical protein [Natronorubrum thiooxidans]SIR77085.1 hypothetical protein SAMN05421752_102381 [Natronorubrum thiooxidans]